MRSVFVVDTGTEEVYVIANDECDASEQVAAAGKNVNYAEHYSDDLSDLPQEYAL